MVICNGMEKLPYCPQIPAIKVPSAHHMNIIYLILAIGEKYKLGKLAEKAKEKRRISLTCY